MLPLQTPVLYHVLLVLHGQTTCIMHFYISTCGCIDNPPPILHQIMSSRDLEEASNFHLQWPTMLEVLEWDTPFKS